jgi:hypothetical protein
MKRLIPLFALAGCYTGAAANRDVAESWRGRTQGEIVGRWGAPERHVPAAPDDILVWDYQTRHVELPDARLSVRQHEVGVGVAAAVGVRANVVDVDAAFKPGGVWNTTHEGAAIVDREGAIRDVQGAALHWGPPNDVNLHWGTIFGAHVGLGRLDSTPTPLPSGGAYIGGMLGPTFALVGTYSLAAGTGDAGGAMGMAGGLAAQWWPMNRIWVRAGPALLLAFDPGFDNARLRPGVTTGASWAFVKVGVLAVDLRLDLSAGPSTVFGTLGVGVNLN